MNTKPRLRYVEAFPVETENGQMIALRDPAGIATETIVLSHAAVYILQYFTGEHDIDDIMRILSRETDLSIEKNELEALIDQLDTNLFLDNENFLNRRKDLELNFLSSGVRPARYAGNSYPENKTELQNTLQSFYTTEGGAGPPGEINGQPTPAGIIAPHIDLRIGGSTYSHAYKALAESPPADLYVIIGTGHSGLQNIYSVLPIDFETPLGRVETDKQFIKNLKDNSKSDFFSEVLPHKTEHAVEFQVVFLQQALSKRPFKIVPMLASFGFQFLQNPLFAAEQEMIAEFTQALKKTIAEYPGKVTVLASVDMAHVGPRYGDNNIPDAQFLELVKEADMQALENVRLANAEGWAKSIAEIEDRYRVCGFAPVYTLLQSIQANEGKILKYDKGLMDDNQSVVSYCSAVLY